MIRYLGHRFGMAVVNQGGELREAADTVVFLYATALRMAAAMGAVPERPVDRAVFQVALGAGAFVYRSLNLPRETLPWFSSAHDR